MDKCESCGDDILPFASISKSVERTILHQSSILQQNSSANNKNILKNAFVQSEEEMNIEDDSQYTTNVHNDNSISNGFMSLIVSSDNNNNNNNNKFNLIYTSSPSSYYYYRKPNCFLTAISSGIRGAVVGSVFGGAMGLSTSVQSGFRGTTVLTHAGQSALRNAATFSSWTALFGFTKCGFVRLRGRDDVFNAAAAGFLTGGVLSFISVRGYWRYNQASILSNAASSAMIAILFQSLNQI